MSNPEITVIVPAYNVAGLVLPCLASIMAQSFGAWQAMGSPARPTPAQVAMLKRAARLTPEALRLTGGRLTLSVPRQGVVLVEL